MDGSVKRVLSGYRPTYDVAPDFWTSVHHVFEAEDGVATEGQAIAEVWFFNPEGYPHSLWPGRALRVADE